MERLFNSISIDVYRSLISNNPDAIFLLDTKGNVLDINKSVTNILGCSVAESTGLNFQNILIHSTDYNVKRLFVKTLRGEPCTYQADAYHRNGQILHLQVKHVPMFDNGKLVGVMIIAEDVTELFQTRKSLQETSEKLKSLLNSSADAIDIVDLNGNVLSVNPAFEDMYGWKEDEIIGKQMPTIPKERWKAANERREKAILGEYTKGLEVDCLRKDGKSIYVNITISALHDEKAKVVGFLGISRDITERKVVEEALTRSEEKYRLIAENMTDLVSIIDENGVLKYISPSFFPLLGVSLEGLNGKLVIQQVHPEDASRVKKAF